MNERIVAIRKISLAVVWALWTIFVGSFAVTGAPDDHPAFNPWLWWGGLALLAFAAPPAILLLMRLLREGIGPSR